jgi:hypothetical protein
MKKPQRNFVVEFKSGSRRQYAKPTSIWGNLDLKAISLEVEADAAGQVVQTTNISANRSPPSLQSREPLLTKIIEQPKTMLPPQEERMAEETTPIVGAENSSTQTVTPITEPKKRRGRQPKTVAPTIVATDEKSSISGDAEVTPVKIGKQARVSKTASVAGAKVAAKQSRKTRVPRQETVVVNASAGDEMADLLQLEGENQTLRKQLAEKLRSENADLRRRLGHS